MNSTVSTLSNMKPKMTRTTPLVILLALWWVHGLKKSASQKHQWIKGFKYNQSHAFLIINHSNTINHMPFPLLIILIQFTRPHTLRFRNGLSFRIPHQPDQIIADVIDPREHFGALLCLQQFSTGQQLLDLFTSCEKEQ